MELLVKRIKEYKPKNACIIHGVVMEKFERCTGIHLEIGDNGKVFPDQDTTFYCNYFPNGNSGKKEIKIEIYKMIRKSIEAVLHLIFCYAKWLRE